MAELDDERVNDALNRASNAFWASISGSFPEITSGDVDPFCSIEWDGFVEDHVRRWVADNSPALEELND